MVERRGVNKFLGQPIIKILKRLNQTRVNALNVPRSGELGLCPTVMKHKWHDGSFVLMFGAYTLGRWVDF